MRYIYFFNDFDILYIIILSDLFITMIFFWTYHFLFFQVASASATSLEYDRMNISDSDSDIL